MTRTANLAQHSVDRRKQSRPAPPASGALHEGRISNAALAAVFDTLRLESTGRAPLVPSVQRGGPDPKKVAAAGQAKSSDEAARLLKRFGLGPGPTGPFGLLRELLARAGLPVPAVQLGPLALMLQLAARAGLPVGVDSEGSPVNAHVIPGQIADVAMVVAGVHGSEQSGVEVAERLLKQLASRKPYFTVVIVPRLFPTNVASRAAWEERLAKRQSNIAINQYRELRDKAGDVGRETKGRKDPGRETKGRKDPNRQFPELGQDLDLSNPVDSKGEIIEPSNLALLALINVFKPSRIVSIHAVKDLAKAGIFADPHPSVPAYAKSPMAKHADALALAMAKKAKTLGVKVRGNEPGGTWTSLYPGQDRKKSAEQMKKEDAKGRSFGQWAPSRGITVITVEVGEQYRSDSAVKDPNRAVELEAQATVIREIFLGPPVAVPSPAPVWHAPTPAPLPAPVQRMLIASLEHNVGNQTAAIVARHLAH